MNEIRKVLTEVVDRFAECVFDDPDDARIADKELIVRARGILQSMPTGGAWYPKWEEIDAAVPGLVTKTAAEAVAKFAIDAYRERGGQSGEVVRREWRIKGSGEQWNEINIAAQHWIDQCPPERQSQFETRELVVRGSGPVVDDDAAQAYQDQLEDAEVQARMIREALGVAYEPHQSLHERTLERVRELTSQPAVAGDAGVVAWRELNPKFKPGNFNAGCPDAGLIEAIESRGLGIELAYSRSPSPTVPDEVMAAAESLHESLGSTRSGIIRDWLKSTTRNADAQADARDAARWRKLCELLNAKNAVELFVGIADDESSGFFATEFELAEWIDKAIANG